ncbi:MAG: hypothetical protein U0232_10025 [Thermomicrobiales bacterium]
MRFARPWRTSSSKVRTVPSMIASSGMMLRTEPAWRLPIVTTAWRSGLTSRLTSVWSATMHCAATTIGSMQRCGPAAWPPRPRMRMLMLSGAAVIGPAQTPMLPAGMSCARWTPNAASTCGFSSTPASIIGSRRPAALPRRAGRGVANPCPRNRHAAR